MRVITGVSLILRLKCEPRYYMTGSPARAHSPLYVEQPHEEMNILHSLKGRVNPRYWRNKIHSKPKVYILAGYTSHSYSVGPSTQDDRDL